MAKVKEVEEAAPAEPPHPQEFGWITYPEYLALPAEVRQRRARRALEKLQAIRGTIHLNIDIDELRGRNRR